VPLRAADASELAELFDEPDPTERFRRWESRRSPDGREGWLNWAVRLRDDRRAVGWVQATVRGDSAEIAYALLPSWRRRGYAAEAVAAMVGWLDVGSVEAHVAEENEASGAVAAAVGLRPTDALHEGEVVWKS
jgi:RimJ/RimL family protein N-acetyltransferase